MIKKFLTKNSFLAYSILGKFKEANKRRLNKTQSNLNDFEYYIFIFCISCGFRTSTLQPFSGVREDTQTGE
jgi:hypothetical protein